MSQIVERQYKLNEKKKKFSSQETCHIKKHSGLYSSLSGLSLQEGLNGVVAFTVIG